MKEGDNRTLRVVKDLISYYLLCGALLVGKIQLCLPGWAGSNLARLCEGKSVTLTGEFCLVRATA